MTHGKDRRNSPPGAPPMAPLPTSHDEAGQVEQGEAIGQGRRQARRSAVPQAATPQAVRGKRKPEAAFDQWLARGLHQMFDAVAKEPVPDDLLKLIEDDEHNTRG